MRRGRSSKGFASENTNLFDDLAQQYAGEEISVSALAERIDTFERNVEDETYHIWMKKLSVSQLGDMKLVIAEKETDEDEEDPVKYFTTNKIDAPTEHVIPFYGMRWRIETFFEDSKQDLGRTARCRLTKVPVATGTF